MSLMKREWVIVGLVLLSLEACGTAPPPPVDSPAGKAETPVDKAPRLIRVGDKLYVKNAPQGATRDARFYVRAAAPIPGTEDHPKIGIIRGLDREGRSTLRVVLITPVDESTLDAITAEGLPVDLVPQDTRARVGRLWGEYVPQPESTWPGAGKDVVLELDLGRGEDVRSGDQYELLGEAKADRLNQTVDSFEKRGTCTVLPFGADATRSRCQVDHGIEPSGLDKNDWIRGGYARAITVRTKGQ
ncbi:hypothetical protein [Polyangium sp. 15x6]|uniref:hypothetical protein n=1 Tax=Polyangium sp. 15x6 TaxID=3042687 RepID=UPI00249C9ED4|nr:hypothetical protein [Polyangium sp. 15x6]MDI3292165.1 hypothetical protein [Polyangium sp. 15x6]